MNDISADRATSTSKPPSARTGHADVSDVEAQAQLLGHAASSGDQGVDADVDADADADADAGFYEAVAAQVDEAERARGTAEGSATPVPAEAVAKPARPPTKEGEGARARKAQAREDKKPWGLKVVSRATRSVSRAKSSKSC